MIRARFERLRQALLKGHERSVKAKFQIIYSILIKGVNISIGFIQVPLILSYLGETKYGLWLTIGSVVGWFSFLDVGLGNGMRNQLGAAFVRNDLAEGRRLVSSAYYAIGIISVCMFFIFAVANHFIDWEAVLSAPSGLSTDLRLVVLVVFGLFCIRFVLKLVGIVFIADQRPALNNVIVPLGSMLSLLCIVLAIALDIQPTILLVGTAITGPIVLVYLGASFYAYFGSYSELRPSLSLIDKTKIRGLVGLGVKFFILQAGQVIIYTTDNMIVSRLFGPSEVTLYFIPHKYFSIITMGFNILMVPMWSAFTNANEQNDVEWIKKTIRKLMNVWLAFLGLSVVLVIVSPFAFRLWIGADTADRIPMMLSVLMSVFVSLNTFTSIFINYLNGVGKVQVQLLVMVLAAGLNIPLSVYLGSNLGLGSSGVILASIICLAMFAVIVPVQYSKLINGRANGIWLK